MTFAGVTTYLSPTEYQKYRQAMRQPAAKVVRPPLIAGPMLVPISILPGHITYVMTASMSRNVVFVGAGGAGGGGISGFAAGIPYPTTFVNHAWDTGPAKPIEEAGIKVGEIIAWRCWSIANGMLKSVAAEAMWPTTEPMTGNVTTAGVHAWKTERGALEYGRGSVTLGVIGRVALWGDVIEHELGYRAEFAKIVSIDYGIGGTPSSTTFCVTRPLPPEVLAGLRRAYGVGGSMPAPELPAPHPDKPHSAVPAVWVAAHELPPKGNIWHLLGMWSWLAEHPRLAPFVCFPVMVGSTLAVLWTMYLIGTYLL